MATSSKKRGRSATDMIDLVDSDSPERESKVRVVAPVLHTPPPSVSPHNSGATSSSTPSVAVASTVPSVQELAALGITSETYNSCAMLLGSKVLSGCASQIIMESDDRYINAFETHELNRNINMEWVGEMKKEILQNIALHERMTLTLAVDLLSIRAAIADTAPFKGIILDGQHRWMAMKELKKEFPALSLQFWVVIYLCRSDIEIRARIEKCNKRRDFSAADSAQMGVTSKFLQAFNSFNVENEDITYRNIIRAVRKSTFIKDTVFVDKHRHKSVDDFISGIRLVCEKFIPAWHEANRINPRLKGQVKGKVIEHTKLYALLDESCNWVNEIP